MGNGKRVEAKTEWNTAECHIHTYTHLYIYTFSSSKGIVKMQRIKLKNKK